MVWRQSSTAPLADANLRRGRLDPCGDLPLIRKDRRSQVDPRAFGHALKAARGSPTLLVQHLFIAACTPQLANDPVKRRSDALCGADVVLLTCRAPEHRQRPFLGAMRQQASQCQADLRHIHANFRAARDTAAQNMNRGGSGCLNRLAVWISGSPLVDHAAARSGCSKYTTPPSAVPERLMRRS
jgi:hypothetical protein